MWLRAAPPGSNSAEGVAVDHEILGRPPSRCATDLRLPSSDATCGSTRRRRNGALVLARDPASIEGCAASAPAPTGATRDGPGAAQARKREWTASTFEMHAPAERVPAASTERRCR